MASMIKNYVTNEFITMETGSSMSSISLQEKFAKYLPTDLTVVKSMPHYFKSIMALLSLLISIMLLLLRCVANTQKNSLCLME